MKFLKLLVWKGASNFYSEKKTSHSKQANFERSTNLAKIWSIIIIIYFIFMNLLFEQHDKQHNSDKEARMTTMMVFLKLGVNKIKWMNQQSIYPYER